MPLKPPPEMINPAYLTLIDSALAHDRWMSRLPGSLLAAFKDAGDVSRRLNNRYVIVALTVLFDLFWLPQWQSAPDIVTSSGVLRFALFTPLTLLFVGLDLRGRLGRLYDPLLLLIAVTPCLITAWLCLHTNEMLAQPELYGTPLILLFTAVLLRMSALMVAANGLICTFFYCLSLVICPMLPRDQIATAVFIQVAVSAAAIIFNLQLESRDRRVFLLTTNERIRRALVVEQNSGLLRETQTDSLTSLANRRCFDETLSSRWVNAIRDGQLISLLMIDVDGFKAYNDHYGHVMGDDCLRRIAGVLAGAARQSDLVARYGGEEFAAILVGESLEGSCAVAERMRTAVLDVSLPHDGLGTGAIVTVSIGLTCLVPTELDGIRKLVELADSNLYRAKHEGRNLVVPSFRSKPAPEAVVAKERRLGVDAEPESLHGTKLEQF
jgi:diguanylate cyclase (GGDEF)-like protein